MALAWARDSTASSARAADTFLAKRSLGRLCRRISRSAAASSRIRRYGLPGKDGGRGQEGKPQLRHQQVGQPVRGHGIGAGHYVIAPGGPSGQDMDQQLMGQAVAVHQLIDPVTLGGRCIKQRHRSLVCHRAQESLLYLSALDAFTLFELPGQDTMGSFGQLLPQNVSK